MEGDGELGGIGEGNCVFSRKKKSFGFRYAIHGLIRMDRIRKTRGLQRNGVLNILDNISKTHNRN
jgi:hypothetical protein